MANMDQTIAVLLAAGAGTRLGLGPKALLPFGESSLVERAAASLFAAGCAEVLVVIGAGAEDVKALQRGNSDFSRCQLIFNPNWRSGMGSSFRVGIEAAVKNNTQSIMVALVDQPSMSADVVQKVLTRHHAGRITAAVYTESRGKLRRGHPVVFDSTLARAAASLSTDDAGARLYLRAHPELVDLVDCSELSDGADLDTPEDLKLLDTK